MRKKKEEETSFVPVNIAVDYVQHKRYLHHTNDHKKTTKAETEEIPPLVVGDNSQFSFNLNLLKSTNISFLKSFFFNRSKKIVIYLIKLTKNSI